MFNTKICRDTTILGWGHCTINVFFTHHVVQIVLSADVFLRVIHTLRIHPNYVHVLRFVRALLVHKLCSGSENGFRVAGLVLGSEGGFLVAWRFGVSRYGFRRAGTVLGYRGYCFNISYVKTSVLGEYS